MIDGLLASDEPSIVLRTRLDVLREDPDSDAVRDAREAVRSSERVQTLLRHASLESPYSKWSGAHWVLVDLSEPMQRSFVELHYPCYWHYDVLFGLRVLTEAGFGDDPRCQAARRD